MSLILFTAFSFLLLVVPDEKEYIIDACWHTKYNNQKRYEWGVDTGWFHFLINKK